MQIWKLSTDCSNLWNGSKGDVAPPCFQYPEGGRGSSRLSRFRTLSTMECPGLQGTVRHSGTGNVDQEQFHEEKRPAATGRLAELQREQPEIVLEISGGC
jgi:hypothetical protein